MNYKVLVCISLCLTLIGTVQATTWTSTSGCWTATDGAYTIVKFNVTGADSFKIPIGVTQVDLLISASGAGGGKQSGGGGGAGGIKNGTLPVTPLTIYQVTVGVKGLGSTSTLSKGGAGNPSSFGSQSANGGGPGGSSGSPTGGNGASGGGAASDGNSNAAGTGIAGQGNNGGINSVSAPGYPGGGGGGNKTAGYSAAGNQTGGDGGAAYDGSWIFGNPAGTDLFAAGGGGASRTTNGGLGGSGIGGNGAISGTAGHAKASTGSGGGGVGLDGAGDAGGDGSDGVVVIRYLTPITTPVASFDSVNLSIATNTTASGWEGLTPFTIQFTNTSTFPPHTSWVWNATELATPNAPVTFNATAYYNPIYTFTQPGNYSIKLNVTGTYGTNISTQNTWVNLTPSLPTIADFVGAPTTGYATTDVSFVDFSTGSYLYSWDWNFGDGGTSTTRNPTHTYSTVGAFDVSLTVAGINGTSTKTVPSYITMTPAPNPDSASKLSFQSGSPIIANLTGYTRTVQISNVVNASWINGTTLFDADHIRITSVATNTTTFLSNTLYSYSINNATGTITFNATNTTGFKAGTTPLSFMNIGMVYDRYATPNSMGTGWGTGLLGNSTYKVQFPVVNLVDTPLKYSWTTYSNFTVINSTPIATEQPSTFIPDLNFTANRYLWSWGDGQTLLSQNTSDSHMYMSPGAKTVSLTAYLIENTSVTNTTTMYAAVSPVYNASYVHADFSANPVNGPVGILVEFTDLSAWGSTNLVSGRTYNWSFGDGLYSTDPYSTITGDVSHVYVALGTYTVNLTVNNTITGDYELKTNYITISTDPSDFLMKYPPSAVTFHVQTIWGDPISDAAVSAQGYSTSMGDWEWISTLLGYPLDEIPFNTQLMTETTDTNGDVAFLMIPTAKYNISTTATGYTFPVLHLTPSDKTYTIVANVNSSEWFGPPDTGTLTDLNVTVSALKYNSTVGFLNITYDDATLTTIGGNIQVYEPNTTRGSPDVLIQTYPITGNHFINSSSISLPQDGKSLKVVVHAQTSVDPSEDIIRNFAVSFKGTPIPIAGFDSTIMLWFAIFLIIFTAMFAGASHAPQIAIAICAESWIFYTLGFLEPLFDMFATRSGLGGESVVFIALATATFLSILWNFREGKRKEKGT